MAEEKMKIVVADVDIGQTTLNLKRTRWTGNKQTRNSHLQKLLNQPGLPKSSEITDVGKLLQYKMQIRQTLMSSGLFKNVTIHSQAYGDNKDHVVDGNDVELLINVVESSRTTGQIGTEVDPNNVGKIEGKFELNFNNWIRRVKYQFYTLQKFYFTKCLDFKFMVSSCIFHQNFMFNLLLPSPIFVAYSHSLVCKSLLKRGSPKYSPKSGV